jgi:hypothetical protein
MLNWLNVARFLGGGLLVTACVGVAVWLISKELRDMLRRVEVIDAFSNLERWADKGGYTILFQEQISNGPLLKNGGEKLVFRVAVQDQLGERKWAWIRPGGRLEVKWTKPESWFASASIASSPSEGDAV